MLIYEDKRSICEALVQALQKTRHLDDLMSLEYSGILADGTERVTALFTNGLRKSVDVTGDSGFAMIKDIMKGLK